MAEALRALEGPLAPMICASEDPAEAHACLRVGACSVNSLWVHVRNAIGGVLESTTLADLVPRPHFVEVQARAAAPAAEPDPVPV
jgi:DNA-binding IscR family transcriptional regulator